MFVEGSWVIVGGGEACGGLLDGKGAVRIEREAYVRADPRHVVCVERQADGELLVDDPCAKRLAEEVE